MKCSCSTSTHWPVVRLGIGLLGLLWFLFGQYNLWMPSAKPIYNHSFVKTNAKKAPVEAAVVPVIEDEEEEEIALEAGTDTLPAWFVYLMDNDMIEEDTMEAFDADRIITRATATPLLNAYAAKAGIEIDAEGEDCDFPDIGEKTDAMQEQIDLSCAYGLLRGSNGNFMPDRNMTPYEVLVTLVRSKAGYLDETTKPWYLNYYTQAKELGLVEDESLASFASGLVSKKQLGQWIYRILSK